MKSVQFSLCLVVVLLTGCATSQNVIVGTLHPPKELVSASIVDQSGNNADMNRELTEELRARGLDVKPPLPAGSRQAKDVDMLVSYTDKWRWDIAMYLEDLDIDIFDAKSGNLIVTGRWKNSLFHGFQDSQKVIRGLLDEMMTKIKAVSANGSN